MSYFEAWILLLGEFIMIHYRGDYEVDGVCGGPGSVQTSYSYGMAIDWEILA